MTIYDLARVCPVYVRRRSRLFKYHGLLQLTHIQKFPVSLFRLCSQDQKMLRILSVVVLSVLIAGISGEGYSKRWSPLGVVEGIKDCGSRGLLGTVDVTDCSVVPCHFIPNSIYDVAIRFTASVTSQNLALNVWKIKDDSEHEHDFLLMEVPIDGVIEAGIEYELKFKLPITTEYNNTAFNIRFYILDLGSLVIEVCAQAPIEIHS